MAGSVMRMMMAALLGLTCATPVAAGELAAERLFGRDPGNTSAYACFSQVFDEAWLKAHPDQNVASMTAFVARRISEGTVWHDGNLQIRFNDSAATYHVTAGCGGDDAVMGCGVDCEGGGFQMTAMSKDALAITVDGYLRFYDTSDAVIDAKTKGFQPGDHTLTLKRSDLRDCLMLIADDMIKDQVSKGVLTH